MKKILLAIMILAFPLLSYSSIITIRPEDSKWFYFVLDTKTMIVKEYEFVKSSNEMRLSGVSSFKVLKGGLTFVINKKVWEFYYCHTQGMMSTVPTEGVLDEAIECDFIVETVEK